MQLVELTTITVSVHRVKSPAPAMGYINTKGWARGRRTVAGTMVLTQLSTDVLATFLTSSAFTSDLSKESQYVKVDQLPPFNISMLFADEYGHMSYQRILGVEFVTSGNIHSIQDMLSEQTRSPRPAAHKTPRAGAQGAGHIPRFGPVSPHQTSLESRPQIEVRFFTVQVGGNICFPLQHRQVRPVWYFSRVGNSRLSIGVLPPTGDFTPAEHRKLAVLA